MIPGTTLCADIQEYTWYVLTIHECTQAILTFFREGVHTITPWSTGRKNGLM